MSKDRALMVVFISVIIAGYFISFLLFYLFGWYSDKRLRKVTRRIRISRFERLYLNFRGGYKNGKRSFSAICVNFEYAGILMLFMIPVSLLLAKIFNNIIVMCRISLAAAAVSIVAIVIAAIYSGSVINKHSKKNSVKRSRSSFKELDNISSGFEKVAEKNYAVKTPAYTGGRTEPDNSKEIKSFKESFGQPRTGRGFYRPVVKNSKLVSLTDMRRKKAESAEETAPDRAQNGSEIRDAIEVFKQKNPIEDENILITNYSQVSEKYHDVKITEAFADEHSLEQGREILRKRKEDLSGSADSISGTYGNSDLDMLKSINDNRQDGSEVGSLKDMIEQQTKGITQ